MDKQIEVKHGNAGECPSCLSLGHFDDMKHVEKVGFAIFEDAIWKNSETKQWECYKPWLT